GHRQLDAPADVRRLPPPPPRRPPDPGGRREQRPAVAGRSAPAPGTGPGPIRLRQFRGTGRLAAGRAETHSGPGPGSAAQAIAAHGPAPALSRPGDEDGARPDVAHLLGLSRSCVWANLAVARHATIPALAADLSGHYTE